MQLLEAGMRNAENRVFNLTETRSEDDPVTGEKGDPYAPRRRPNAERDLAAEAEGRALVGAHGDHDMDVAFTTWVECLDAIDRKFELVEYNRYEL
ncbi:hypothetical protein HQQ81_01600 [Microbacteriaceae bacterium VKM Ac-2854]|nr:hypothetical protein [Microbacteriaceae bacterium VKM Ac-2854]